MTVHSGMLWLPEALEECGIRTVVLDGWAEAQGAYLWTDPDTGVGSYGGHPSCYMIHHTASSSALPSVKDSSGRWSKANVWAGLERDGRLYQTGSGEPTLVFTSSGPARVSSGYGHGPTALDVFRDVRVPWKQTEPDTEMALNRYAWNVETVARGDGSDIDPRVEAALEVMGAVLCERFGWAPWRAIGHVTWSTRKVDPFWQGEPDRIVRIQDNIEELLEEGDMWAEWVRGLVEGWAEDPVKTAQEFTRLNEMDPPVLEPGNNPQTVAYWIDLLNDPGSREWLGFVSRTILLSGVAR